MYRDVRTLKIEFLAMCFHTTCNMDVFLSTLKLLDTDRSVWIYTGPYGTVWIVVQFGVIRPQMSIHTHLSLRFVGTSWPFELLLDCGLTAIIRKAGSCKA